MWASANTVGLISGFQKKQGSSFLLKTQQEWIPTQVD